MNRDKQLGVSGAGFGNALAQGHEGVARPGQNGAKAAGGFELARELTRGAERNVLFVKTVRTDRAGIDAAMTGVDGDDAQRLRPLWGVRFALARRLGSKHGAATHGPDHGRGPAPTKTPPRDGPEPAKRAPRYGPRRDACVPHPPTPDRPRDSGRRPGRNMRERPALRQIGAVVGRPFVGAPQHDTGRRLDQSEAAAQAGVTARNGANQATHPAMQDPPAPTVIAPAGHPAALL